MSATEVKAVLKFVRISPQKVRKLVDAIKGKPAEAAIDMLKFMPQKAAAIVEKVIRSAAAPILSRKPMILPETAGGDVR